MEAAFLAALHPAFLRGGVLGYGVANRLEEGKSEDGDASEEAVAGAQARVTGPRRIGSNGRSEGKVICDKSV